MSVNSKLNKLLFLLFVLLLPLSINAAVSVTSGSQVTAGKSWAYIKYINSTTVLCTQFGVTAPTSCSNSTKLPANVNAGVGRIIEWYNSGNNYICAEKLLTKFMFKHYSKNGRQDFVMTESWASHCGKDIVKNVYYEAESRYTAVDNIPQVTFGSSSLNFSQSGNNFVASTTLDSGGYDVSCSVNYGSVSVSNGIATVTVDKSQYDTNITLTCNTKYQYSAPTTFYNDCGKRKQQLITSSLTTDTVYGAQNSISGSFDNPTPYYYLDLNGILDGQQTWHIKDYGTADIYIDGKIVADDVNDYWGRWPKGTKYEIKDIKTLTGKQYVGDSGNLSGTINNDTSVDLKFITTYSLDLNGILDGQTTWHIKDYGTADIYIGGKLVANDVNDYWGRWPKGTKYEIKDIKTLTGKKYVGDSGNLSGTITGNTDVVLEFISLGSFQVHKTASDSTSVVGFPYSTKNFKFGLYSDSSGLNKIKEEEVDSAGNAYFNDIVPGIYYIKEIETKDGYQIDNTIYEIEIKAGGPDPNTKYNYKKITNLTVCEVEFEKLSDKNNMAQRIGLYRMLKNKYSNANYRNVLNLSMTEAKDACSSLEPNYDYEYGCFSATTHIKDKKTSNSLSISNSNLSMYDDNYYGIYDASENGIKVFCSTSFILENSIGSNFGTIKSGRSIIQAENGVAKGKLTRTCYAYVENYNSYIQNAIKNKLNVDKDNALVFYNNHINSVEIPDYRGDSDQYYSLTPKIENATTSVKNDGILTKIENIVEANYLLPYMYASNKDGKIIYSDSPTYGSNYKPIGKGLISRLNAGPGDYNFYILVSLNNDIFGSGKESENDKLCSYTIENELIDNRNNINLEFRSVKTGIDNSFFSKTGSGTRKIGANWVGNENILKDNNDSYNKNNATEAKYSIILTPAIIEKIRDYNKTNKYDDYNFDCKDNGTICISKYLSKLKNEYGLEINTTNRTNYENIR